MISTLMLRAQLTAKRLARRAVFGTLGGLFALVGFGFLSAAGLIWAIERFGAIPALLAVGGAFVLLGLIVFAFSKIPPRVVDRETAAALADPQSADPRTGAPRVLTAASLAEAFILGLSVARSIGRKD